jgi:hypothetical protein
MQAFSSGHCFHFYFISYITIIYISLTLSLLAQVKVGNCSKFDPDCIHNPYGAGNPYKSDGINNHYSKQGSPYSNQSANNPYATDAPKLYDKQGNHLGKCSSNPFDPDSTSNPYGRYGNLNSSDSINNPYGAGNPNNEIFIGQPPK